MGDIFKEGWELLDGLEYLGWIFFNIGFPIGISFVVLWWASERIPSAFRTGVGRLIGKGELYWSVMAIQASTIFELIMFCKNIERGFYFGTAVVLIFFLVYNLGGAAFTVGMIAAGKSPHSTAPGPVPALIKDSRKHLIVFAIGYLFAHTMADVQQKRTDAMIKKEAVNAAIIKECKRLTQNQTDCEKERK
jgi:hypothetical protein